MAPRSRTTRVAARRCSAGSTASRYGRPPRSGVAVEARKTVMAFTSGALTFVGGIGPRGAGNANGRTGSTIQGMQSSNASAPLGAVLCWPLLRASLAAELLLNRLRHEVHQGHVVGHAVQLQATMKLLRDAGRQLSHGFVALGHRRSVSQFESTEKRSAVQRERRGSREGAGHPGSMRTGE